MDDDRLRRQAVGFNPNAWPELYTVTHHQKLAVIDRRLCYIGGLDLNERRFDTPDHDQAAEGTWSDIQILVEGPEAEEAARHLELFLGEIAEGSAQGGYTYLRRTLSAPRKFAFWYLSPRTIVSEIEEEHVTAFRSARRLIYIETQYFRSTMIADALAEVGSARDDLGLILILPSLPEEVAFGDHQSLDARYGLDLQARCLARIREGFGKRASIATPVQPVSAGGKPVLAQTLAGSPIIHVHNKVLVTDDDFALVGSANLNGRSLRWDTEAALRITDRARVAAVRRALADHWWRDPVSDEALALDRVAEWWPSEVMRNGLRRPEARTGFLVPHDPDKLAELRQPLPGVTEDIV